MAQKPDLGIVLCPPLWAMSNRAQKLFLRSFITEKPMTLDEACDQSVKEMSELQELEIWVDRLNEDQAKRRQDLLDLFGFIPRTPPTLDT